MDEHDEVVGDIGYSKFILRHFTNREGKEGTWGLIHTNAFGPGAQVLAITRGHKVVLERSYRIPLKQYVIELPGGTNDVKGESLENLVRRELLEETGYSGGEYHLLADLPDAPALTDQMNAIFLAYGVEKIGPATPGSDEEIEVFETPLAGIITSLRNKKEPVDPKVFAAISLLPPEFLKEVIS